MAFNPARLNLVLEPIGGVGLRWFNYQTDDTQETLLGAWYFEGARKHSLRLHDLVFISPINGTDEPYILTISAIDDNGDATAINSDITGEKAVFNSTAEAQAAKITQTDIKNIYVRAHSVTDWSRGGAWFTEVTASVADQYPESAQIRSNVNTRRWLLNEDRPCIDDFGGIAGEIGTFDYSFATRNDVAAADMVEFAVKRGRQMGFGYGRYWFTGPVNINYNQSAYLAGKMGGIYGMGQRVTELMSTASSGEILRIHAGEMSDGTASCLVELADMFIRGNAYYLNQTGLLIEGCTGYTVRNVTVFDCSIGHRMANVVAANYINFHASFNDHGVHAESTIPVPVTNNWSPPNIIQFLGSYISVNYRTGGTFVLSAPVTFFGGSLEANGRDSGRYATDPVAWEANRANRYTIKMVNAGYNGGIPLAIYGTHLESGDGLADIIIQHDAHPAVYIIQADFIKNFNTVYNPISHVNFQSTGASASRLILDGSSFLSVNGYVPSGTRPVVVESGTLTKHKTSIRNIQCMNKLEYPVITGTGASDRDDTFMRVSFQGADVGSGLTGVNAGYKNVASITKLGTGHFRVNFARNASDVSYIVKPGTAFGDMVLSVSARTTGYVEIYTKTTAGTVTDFAATELEVTGALMDDWS